MRLAIYERRGGAGFIVRARPQSVCCAVRQRRSATLSTSLGPNRVKVLTHGHKEVKLGDFG